MTCIVSKYCIIALEMTWLLLVYPTDSILMLNKFWMITLATYCHHANCRTNNLRCARRELSFKNLILPRDKASAFVLMTPNWISCQVFAKISIILMVVPLTTQHIVFGVEFHRVNLRMWFCYMGHGQLIYSYVLTWQRGVHGALSYTNCCGEHLTNCPTNLDPKNMPQQCI